LQQERRTTIRILLVGDSEAILKFVSGALNAGRDVEVVGYASNGAEAVAKSEALNPDVVIMDFEMPIMDRLGTTKHINQANHKIAVALVCGPSDSLVESIFAGADGYIASPVTPLVDLPGHE